MSFFNCQYINIFFKDFFVVFLLICVHVFVCVCVCVCVNFENTHLFLNVHVTNYRLTILSPSGPLGNMQINNSLTFWPLREHTN